MQRALNMVLFVVFLCVAILPKSAFSVTFTHPMTVINAQELALVKSRIQAGTEPQKSRYDTLILRANSYLTFSQEPPAAIRFVSGYDINRSQFPTGNFGQHSLVAYTLALAWAYSGDNRYADKSIAVMNAWATKGTVISGMDPGLALGADFSQMMYAVDLLHDYTGWNSNARTAFFTWWRRNVLVYMNMITYVMANNWLDNAMMGVMATAVAMEDSALYNKGIVKLASYFSGSWKFLKDDRGSYLPEEVTRNSGRSGITYTSYALTSMVQVLEMARYGGYNFWNTMTDAPQATCVREVIEQYWRWNYNIEPFPWNTSAGKTSSRGNILELVKNNCTISSAMDTWIQSHRPLNGSNGDIWTTLNKGNMPVAQKAIILSESNTQIDPDFWSPFSPLIENLHSQIQDSHQRILVFDAKGRPVGVIDGSDRGALGKNIASQYLFNRVAGTKKASTRKVSIIK